MSGFDEYDDFPPGLQIKPQKFKLPLFSDPIIPLPREASACPECGSIWGKIETSKIDEKVDYWLRGDTLKGVSSCKCKSCSSELALRWPFYGKLKYYFIYDRKGGFYVLGYSTEPKISNECIICRNCGSIEYFSSKKQLNKKSKGAVACHVPKFL
ncbi:hypothetical protein HF888_09130 [Bermanella marisrubri]|uniref:Uncharacterized protein n=1 Tax=Bermanella marisrubri TaxID=207949 RepID=Q1N6J8_9GAMM|nr:hypothetical protein [Bermanella marisrubri]EAT13594.1 hypothetical protein RED65_09389 [Oceanobacter sp. RED65] [Bermanella marisrubri]QIZ84382.1 hypothetical protein HF888_09130 [Bermanella marisrubri]